MQALTGLLGAVAPGSLLGSVITDRAARNPLRFIGSLLNLRNSPFARRKIALRLLEYNRPGFHPDARDTEVPVVRWLDALLGAAGELNELPVRPPARSGRRGGAGRAGLPGGPRPAPTRPT